MTPTLTTISPAPGCGPTDADTRSPADAGTRRDAEGDTVVASTVGHRAVDGRSDPVALDRAPTGCHACGRADSSRPLQFGRVRGLPTDAGMATAEYAIVTIAAVAFGGLLITILTSAEVRGLLLGLIRGALSV
ncbi:MAG TPA: DUF4244 domain-containing protein [Cellulomonas sp.]